MQVMNVLSASSRAFNDDIGVLIKDIGPADFEIFAAGFFQKPS